MPDVIPDFASAASETGHQALLDGAKAMAMTPLDLADRVVARAARLAGVPGGRMRTVPLSLGRPVLRTAFLAAVCALLLLAFVVDASPAQAQVGRSACTFKLGFKTLRDIIPQTVGACLEDERHNPQNGDGLQRTTGGLLVWRKADNWTAFTDGYRTWVNGPYGLQARLNTQQFPWEAGAGPGRPPVAVPTEQVHPSLAAAWSALAGLDRPFPNGEYGSAPIGQHFSGILQASGVRLTVAPLPASTRATFRLPANVITVNQTLLREDARTLAAVLAHELTHAGQGRRGDCVTHEVNAFRDQSNVWYSFWNGYGPGRTGLEQELNGILRLYRQRGEAGLREMVMGSPGYRDQCNL